MLVAATRRGPDNLGDLAQMLETVQAEIVPFDADQARAAQAVYMRYGKACIQRRGSICAMRRVRPGETPQRSPAL